MEKGERRTDTIRSIYHRPLPLLLFSAFLAAIPLTFPSLWLFSFVSFVPFFFVLLQKSQEAKLWRSVGRGIFFGFFYHAFVYFWFLWLYPMEQTGFSLPLALFVVLLAWLGISFFHGALFAIPSLLVSVLGRKFRSRPFLLFAGVVGVLFALRIPQWSQLAFPWIRVSLGLYRAPALIQLASVLGVEGVDFLCLSVSALLSYVLVTQGKKRLFAASLALFLFVSNLAFGLCRIAFSPEKGEEIRVAAVQGCLLPSEKWSGNESNLKVYESMTKSLSGEGFDLVIWPESAIPLNLSQHEDLLKEFQTLSGEIDAPILMGCFWQIDGVTSNSAILVEKDQLSSVYSKRHLVPFGEKVPYRSVLTAVLPFLGEINMLSNDLAAGTEPEIISGEKGDFGAIICFESLFAPLVRESVRAGAEMLVLVTNDSWYEDSPAIWQHLAHAVFRSVENGRGTARCANSGVSALIDAYGQIPEELGPMEKGVLVGDLSFSHERTLYTLLGDTTLPLCSFALLLWGLGVWMRERRECVVGEE